MRQIKTAILQNFLPEDVAIFQQRGDSEIRHSVQQVTVLATQIHGLSKLEQEQPVEQVTQVLSQIFDSFAQHMQPYGIEMHHTVNENFFAVCGLSRTHLDHCKRVADFALEMLRTFAAIGQEHQVSLGLGIGVHSGPLVGAMLGTSRFDYKVWGETVDIVLRLSQNTQPNQILVTKTAQQNLQNQYSLHPGQTLELDRLGAIPVWELAIAQPVARSI